MDLMDLLKPELVITNLPCNQKQEIINKMVGAIKQDFSSAQKQRIKKALMEREALGSTAIGGGIALPHIRMRFIKKWTLVVGFSKQGFQFDSIDNKKTYIIFMLLQPIEDGLGHLKILSQISTMFRNPNTLNKLLKIEDNNELINVLDKCLHQPV